MTQLKKRTLHREEENRRGGINTKFHADNCDGGSSINAVRPAEFAYAVDHEFLHQIRTVRDAGDERCAGNRNPMYWKTRADGADQ